MPPRQASLGQFARLPIVRFGSPGAFLALEVHPGQPPRSDVPTVLLLGPEIPEGAAVGDEVDVFLALDSEGRPIATTRTPKVTLGEVAFLRVTSVTHFGAFVDWGLPKELLVPFAEQTRELHVGDLHPFGLYVDDRGRFAATMRVSEMLGRPPHLDVGAWVEGEAWRYDRAIGIFVICERTWVGLVPASERSALKRGESARLRVSNVLADGKVELSLRGPAHEEIADDAQRIIRALAQNTALRIGDQSSPDEIFEQLGLSKKAFKRAVGRLLREGTVVRGDDGCIDLGKSRIRS